MPKNRLCESPFASRQSSQCFAADLRLNCVSILAAFCLLAPQLAHSQTLDNAVASNTQPMMDTTPGTTLPEMKTPLETASPLLTDMAPEAEADNTSKPPVKQPVESELIVEGLASYGNYRIFASGRDFKLYTAGLEYDRHIWDYFLKARLDYVAEVLPVVILNEPDKTDIWGGPTSLDHKLVPGFGISPIGFRMLWRNKKAIEPYLTAKGGLIAFPIKVPSNEATYVNFSLQSGFGVQVKVSPKLGLRLGLWNDFHFSNAFMVPVNPGLDVMNANLGLSYHFGQ